MMKIDMVFSIPFHNFAHHEKHIVTMIRPLLLSTLALSAASQLPATQRNSRPNIIYILADDLGYGDLSCYGQTKFNTPNIDKMAQDGMRFTQHYSGSTVSAPTRACLMTGLHTGHSYVRGNSDNTFPSTVQTFPGMLQREGYVTGMYGKWGLGNYPSTGEPDDHGFNEFFGYTNQGLAHRHYPDVLIDNGVTVTLPGNDWLNKVVYAPDTIHKRALDFIDRHQQEPFFLYCSYTIPHAEIIVPEDSIFQSYKGRYSETAYKGSDYIGAGTKTGSYCSQPFPKATFMSMIARLDLYVGQIIKKLDELGLSENTIIMFSSDNGPHQEGGANPDFFNSSGGYRGIKRDLYDGGVKIPFIVKWPGKIAPGLNSDHLSAHWDIFPTIKDLISSDETFVGDGISLLPTLLQQGTQKAHKYLYWEFFEKEGRRGLRWNDWKLVQYNMTANPNATWLLYDLKNDPGETTDVAAGNPVLVDKLKNAVELEHVKSDKLQWTFEKYNNIFNVKIIVKDRLENPVNNAKVVLQSYGNRITWEEGLAMFRGISAGNVELKVSVDEVELYSQTITITDRDLLLPVVLNITGVSSVKQANIVNCYFDKSLHSIRLKSEQTIVRYRVLNYMGIVVDERQCADNYMNIPVREGDTALQIIETMTLTGEKQVNKVICW
jgi:arylsulfatase A-like enzyme